MSVLVWKDIKTFLKITGYLFQLPTDCVTGVVEVESILFRLRLYIIAWARPDVE